MGSRSNSLFSRVTISREWAWVPPPAPYVTETKSGFMERSRSTTWKKPGQSTVSFGGKNSREMKGFPSRKRSTILTKHSLTILPASRHDDSRKRKIFHQAIGNRRL
jgi:hypothetical protein